MTSLRTLGLLKISKNVCETVVHRNVVSAAPLHIKRAVVLSKMTRYEVERDCNPHMSPEQLKEFSESRGIDIETLLKHYERHTDYEQYVMKTFEKHGIDAKLVKKPDYTNALVEWCDAVFPIGGDGTFLLAANQIRHNTKPIIGFNSDPEHSEGFLCLPKRYSNNIEEVLLKLEKGSFSWLLRTRIRVTVNCVEGEPIQELHDKRTLGAHRTEQNWCIKRMSSFAGCHDPLQSSLALNEVFIGETQAALVSYLEMRLTPEGETTKFKSSGLCVNTGTGSSSWHLSMNRITPECVALVLQCAGVSTSADPHTVAAKYNDALLFNPEEEKMCYTIRDLISAGVWPSPPGLAPRGFSSVIRVRSHCRDARLVIDGGASYSFNDGSEALFEIHPEDTLRTVVM